MEIKYINIENISPYKNNPRDNSMAVEPVMESIKEFGFNSPIVISENGVIITGHTRYEAGKRIGYKELPCIIADDLNHSKQKKYRIVDNKTQEESGWDFDKLEEEMKEIETEIDMGKFGFTEIVSEISDLPKLDLGEFDDSLFEEIETKLQSYKIKVTKEEKEVIKKYMKNISGLRERPEEKLMEDIREIAEKEGLI